MSETRSMIDAALEYARQGFQVFPCEPAGKKPIIANWPDRATTDPVQIGEWWAKWPNANIGMLTGRATGIVVVDLDTNGNGPENMSQLEIQHGHLPITPKAITGSGGVHLIFKYPENLLVKSRAGIVNGIDTRADGGYIIAPPSLHPSGRKYEWAPGCGMGEVEPAECPKWLLQLITASKVLRLVGRDEADTRIGRGERNSKLASMAGAMRHRGMIPEAIQSALLKQNSSCCPPLPEEEVVSIARSISRYAPAAVMIPLTELGNAERLVRDHGTDIRYCPHLKKWLVWDGIRWKPDQVGLVNRRANDTIRQIREEARLIDDADKRKELLKWQKMSESGKAVREILGIAKSLEGIPVVPEELDTNPWIINVNNGGVDLKTGELLPHRREDLITKLAPVTFDSTATCPTWIAFLRVIMNGNQNMINFLQCAMGYALTGETREQCLFILHGNGSNGKSTLIGVLNALCGEDYSTNIPFETLMVRKSEGVRNDIASLRGARLVTAIEAEKGQRLAESLVKSMTGGDKLTARFLYGEFFSFIPEFKLFLATNYKPEIRGTDNAIWRRVHLIPFEVTIPEEKKDIDLPNKLLSELPGILNWTIEGCLQWQKEGLGVPSEVKDATANYRAEMDVTEDFLADCFVREEGSRVDCVDAYAEYLTWCNSNGEKPDTKKGLSSQLKEKLGDPKRNGTNGRYAWQGIGLIPKVDDVTSLNGSASEAAGQHALEHSHEPASTAGQTCDISINLADSFAVKFDNSDSDTTKEELDKLIDLF